MLTVRQALALPVLAPAQLVAGAQGLDNQINWVHIIDMAGAQYEWQRQDVLLLTTGFGIEHDAAWQRGFIAKLVHLGFAGVVLSTGHYFQHAPEGLRSEAERLGLPLIETPPTLLFIEVTRVVLERIVNQQYALLQQSMQINQQLTALVLQGGDLAALATTLAAILQRSITIESPTFRVLAAAKHGAVDEARERSVASGHGTPEIVQRLLAAGVYDQLLRDLQLVHVNPLPELGMSMERIVAPIVTQHEIQGYVWVIAGERPLTQLDETALSHGATVAALIQLKHQSVQKAEETLRGDFFAQLLHGEKQTSTLLEQAYHINYRFDRAHQVLVVNSQPRPTGEAGAFREDVRFWLQAHTPHTLLIWRDDYLVVVVELNAAETAKPIAHALLDAMNQPTRQLLVGVGNVCSAKDELGTVRQSYEEAREAVQIALTLSQTEGVVEFAALGLLHWLYHIPPERLASNHYTAYVDTLVAYDKRHKADLLKTLEVYLDHGGAIQDAAQALYIHRNTLLHRIERIEQRCTVDLRDVTLRLNLHAAIKSYRLHR